MQAKGSCDGLLETISNTLFDLADKDDFINGTLRLHGFHWQNCSTRQMRVCKSPGWNEVIVSLGALKDPAVFEEAVHIVSLAFQDRVIGADWLGILMPKLLDRSQSSAPLATVLAQFDFEANAAVGIDLSELLASLSSAKATAEAKVLQAENNAKRVRPPGRPNNSQGAQHKKQPHFRTVDNYLIEPLMRKKRG